MLFSIGCKRFQFYLDLLYVCCQLRSFICHHSFWLQSDPETIYDALLDYGRVAWRWCVKKIIESLTFEQKILENFDKGWRKESRHLYEGR
jgi:hypothetical protein